MPAHSSNEYQKEYMRDYRAVKKARREYNKAGRKSKDAELVDVVNETKLDGSLTLRPEGRQLGDDELMAEKILNDLRYAYKYSRNKEGFRGRARLEKIMEDDKEFKVFVKELLRIETQALAKGEGNLPNLQQNFFVVLKGLDTPVARQVGDKTLDMGQIGRATNPLDLTVGGEVEEERNSREAPEMLVGHEGSP